MAEQKQVETKKEGFVERAKNPLFLAAGLSFIYTAYTKLAAQYGLPQIELGDFQLAVDLLAYVILGTGIYSTFNLSKQS